MIEKLYTVEEVAELASVTGRTIRNYLKSGRLVGRKIGGQWRFPEAEVQRLLTGGLPEDEPEAPAPSPAPEREPAPALKIAPQPAPPPVVESAYDEEFEATYEPAPAPAPSAAPPQAPPRQPAYYNEPAPLPGAAQPVQRQAPPPEPHYQPEAAPAPQPVRQSTPVQQPAPLPGTAPQMPTQAAPQPQRDYEGPYPIYQQPAQPVYSPPAYAPTPQPPVYDAPQPQLQPQPQPGPALPQAFSLPQQAYPVQDAALYRPAVPPVQPGYAGGQPPLFVTASGVLYEAVPVGGYPQQAPMPGPAQPTQPAQPVAEAPAAEPVPEPAPAEKPAPPPDAPPFPHLSDVGNRVTRFISEVHDYSKGPQMCAVVDLHQSFSAARITSQRLADIADEESEAGLLCQSFVEFDERFYVARYTLFGTTSYLLRCLKLIG